jgi:hypothetical protein
VARARRRRAVNRRGHDQQHPPGALGGRLPSDGRPTEWRASCRDNSRNGPAGACRATPSHRRDGDRYPRAAGARPSAIGPRATPSCSGPSPGSRSEARGHRRPGVPVAGTAVVHAPAVGSPGPRASDHSPARRRLVAGSAEAATRPRPGRRCSRWWKPMRSLRCPVCERGARFLLSVSPRTARGSLGRGQQAAGLLRYRISFPEGSVQFHRGDELGGDRAGGWPQP